MAPHAMLCGSIVVAVVCLGLGQETDYVKYPGFHGVTEPTSTTTNTEVSVCNTQCDAGPMCDCTSFLPAGVACAKLSQCPASPSSTRYSSSTRSGVATAFASSEDGTLTLSSVVGPSYGQATNADWKLTVDDTNQGKRQEITGFGAAWTDATVAVFDALPSSQQDQLMEDLFGASGIGLGLMRHTVGQSDMSPNGRWSFDENSNQSDPSLVNFDLTDAGRRMLQWLQRMFQKNTDIHLLGSVWSPPYWMKQDNTIQMQYQNSWVDYMVKYIQAFKDQGVNVSAMTIQNEPLHNGPSAWTTFLDASWAADLSNNLLQAISVAGLQTELWAYDHNTDVPEYPAYVIQHAPQVKTVAWHCYAGGNWSSLWGNMTKFHDSHPNVKQYMTECWTHLATEGFFDLPGFVTGPLMNYGSGALAWTLGGSTKYDVAYPGGCDPCSGIIQVDRDAKTYQKTQDYYTLGQWSKFVQKGAVYLSGTGSYIYEDGTGVRATSFLNPNGDRVVVIVNMIERDVNMQVDFRSGDSWSGVVHNRSVTTWVISDHTLANGAPVFIV